MVLAGCFVSHLWTRLGELGSIPPRHMPDFGRRSQSSPPLHAETPPEALRVRPSDSQGVAVKRSRALELVESAEPEVSKTPPARVESSRA